MYLFTGHLCIYSQVIYVFIHIPLMYLLTADLCIYSQPIYVFIHSRFIEYSGHLDSWCRHFLQSLWTSEGRLPLAGQCCLIVSLWLSLIGNIREGNLYLAPRFWEGSPRRGGASIAGPFEHFALTFLGLFKTMTMTFLGLWPEHQRPCLFHPRLHPRHVHPLSFALWEVRTYIERDVIYIKRKTQLQTKFNNPPKICSGTALLQRLWLSLRLPAVHGEFVWRESK